MLRDLFNEGGDLQKVITSVTFAKLTLLTFHESNDAEELKESRFPVTLELQPVKIFEIQLCKANVLEQTKE